MYSCSIVKTDNFQSSTLFPDYTQLNLDLNQIELIGTKTVEIDYTTYLGLFTRIKSINGKAPDKSFKQYAVFSGDHKFKSSKKISRAMYDLYTEFTDADYIDPIVSSVEIQKMFLGRKVTRNVKVNVYKLKMTN